MHWQIRGEVLIHRFENSPTSSCVRRFIDADPRNVNLFDLGSAFHLLSVWRHRGSSIAKNQTGLRKQWSYIVLCVSPTMRIRLRNFLKTCFEGPRLKK